MVLQLSTGLLLLSGICIWLGLGGSVRNYLLFVLS
jgi:hypothetical protein